MKIYFIDDALFQEYQQEKGWFCFPAQDREDTRNRGGLEGKVRLADGSEQLLVCYPSLPQKRETKSDNWEEFETQEFLDNGESPEMLHPEPNPETKGAVLEDPESEQEQTDQTQGDPTLTWSSYCKV